MKRHRQMRTSPTRRNVVPLLLWKPEGAPVDLALVNNLRDDRPLSEGLRHNRI